MPNRRSPPARMRGACMVMGQPGDSAMLEYIAQNLDRTSSRASGRNPASLKYAVISCSAIGRSRRAH